MSWTDEYNAVVKNPPGEGDVLVTVDGAPAQLIVELNEGSSPLIYGRIYVPDIVGEPLGWFLWEETKNHYGWKCILMPRARANLIQKHGIQETLLVKALRVVKKSQSGKALLCEVAENVE